MSTMRVKNKDGSWDKIPVLGSYQAVIAANAAASNAQNAAAEAETSASSVRKYKALWFNSVAAMKAEPSLTAGAYVNTAGYYEPNDGGGASYLIREKLETDTDDGGSLHELSNGLVAELIVENGTVCPEQFGAKGDGITDDANAFQICINYATNNKLTVNLHRNHYINSTITTNGDLIIYGNLNKIYTNVTNGADGKFNLFSLGASLSIFDVIAENSVLETESGWGFCFGNSNTVIADGCVIKGFRSAIHSIGDNSIIKNNYIELSTVKDANNDTFYGIHGEFSNGLIDNNEIHNGRHSIYLSGKCENVIVSKNRCFDSKWQAIHVYSVSNNRKANKIKIINNIIKTTELQAIIVVGYGTDIDISGNTCEATTSYCIKVEGAGNENLKFVTVFNNICSGQQGIHVYNAGSVTLADNNIDVAYQAILCEGGNKNCIINNNMIDCGENASYIVWVANASDIQLTNNVLKNLPTARWDDDTKIYGCGFRVEGTTNARASNNIVDGYTVEGYLLSGAMKMVKSKTTYDTVPSTMPHREGDRYYFTNSVNVMAVCTANGTPGTFKYIGG